MLFFPDFNIHIYRFDLFLDLFVGLRVVACAVEKWKKEKDNKENAKRIIKRMQ